MVIGHVGRKEKEKSRTWLILPVDWYVPELLTVPYLILDSSHVIGVSH